MALASDFTSLSLRFLFYEVGSHEWVFNRVIVNTWKAFRIAPGTVCTSNAVYDDLQMTLLVKVHFIDEETEAEKGKATAPKPHPQGGAELLVRTQLA